VDEGRVLALQLLSESNLSDGIEHRLLHVLWNAGERELSADRLQALLTRVDSRLPDAHLTLARWRHKLGQIDLARVSLRQARRGTPATAAAALLLAAQIEVELGEAALGLSLIRQAQTLQPDLIDVWLAETQLLIKLNQLSEAREVIQRAPPALIETPAGSALLQRLIGSSGEAAPPAAEPSDSEPDQAQ
jgi:predicted Zn-dependent protease